MYKWANRRNRLGQSTPFYTGEYSENFSNFLPHTPMSMSMHAYPVHELACNDSFLLMVLGQRVC